MQNLLEIQEFQQPTSLPTLGTLRTQAGDQQGGQTVGASLPAKGIRVDDIYKGISTTLRRTLLEHCLTPQSLNMLTEKMNIEKDQLERELDVMWRGGWVGLPNKLGYYRVNREFVANHARTIRKNLEDKFGALGEAEGNQLLSMQIRALINPEHRRILDSLVKDPSWYDHHPYPNREFLEFALRMFCAAEILRPEGIALPYLGSYLGRLERL
jgi:hypothetical protein